MGELINLNSPKAIADADIPAAIARDTEVTTAINAHTAAADPHAQYLLQSEGDALYRQTSVALADADIPAAIARDSEVTAAVNAHVAATDPHLQYPTQSRGDARYVRKYAQKFHAAPPISQPMPAGLITKVNFASQLVNGGNQFANSRLTAIETESWKLNVFVTFELSTAGRVVLYLVKNNSILERLMDSFSNSGFFGISISPSTVELVAQDYLEIWATLHSNNSKIYGDAALDACWWKGVRIS